MTHRSSLVALSALLALALTGCADPATSPSDEAGSDAASGAPSAHGAIAGAEEVAEPPLHLVAIDATGRSSMLDLLGGEVTELESFDAPSRVTTDGRYVFVANETGVEMFDSGVWTWDHVDHFHFYRADARKIGAVPGSGVAEISGGLLSTAGSTGVFFPGTGDALLLDNAALADGDIEETLRIDTGARNGLIVPLGAGALVTEASTGSRADQLRVIAADGAKGDQISCEEPAGSITTRVGVVVGCADGAVLAVENDDGGIALEKITYPAGAAAPATTFSARKGRPTVAGLGSDAGTWLLDTREQAWRWIPSETPLLEAASVDNEAGHVVTVGVDGVVRVYEATTGSLLAETEPLLAKTLLEAHDDPDLLDGIALTVDANRAYLNAPAEGVVYEIDYADGARIARVLETKTRPVHLVEAGR